MTRAVWIWLQTLKKIYIRKKIQKQNWGLSTDFCLFMGKKFKMRSFQPVFLNREVETYFRVTCAYFWVAINLCYRTMRLINGSQKCVFSFVGCQLSNDKNHLFKQLFFRVFYHLPPYLCFTSDSLNTLLIFFSFDDLESSQSASAISTLSIS